MEREREMNVKKEEVVVMMKEERLLALPWARRCYLNQGAAKRGRMAKTPRTPLVENRLLQLSEPVTVNGIVV